MLGEIPWENEKEGWHRANDWWPVTPKSARSLRQVTLSMHDNVNNM